MPLVCPGNVAARRAPSGQTNPVQIVDNHLAHRQSTRRELRMAKRVLQLAQISQLEPLTHNYDGAAARPEHVVHLVGQLWELDPRLGQKDEQRHLPLRVGQPSRRWDEPNAPAHRLQHQDRIRWAGAPVLLLCALHHTSPVARHAAVSRRVVDELELGIAHVVVDRLGHPNCYQVQTTLVRQHGDLAGGIHRVIAAVVEKIADTVRSKDLDDPPQILIVLGTQLVAAGANSSGRRCDAQQGDLIGGLRRHVQQVLLEHALNAVIAGINCAEHIRHLAADLHHAAQRAVDDGRGAAGLGNHNIAILHA